MTEFDPIRYKAATAVFKLASKTSDSGTHRTLNREPKGKGWIQCPSLPEGMLCKPDKVREAIEYYKIAYEIFPDIVALNQIALGYEMVGDLELARKSFLAMKTQAEAEENDAYVQAAELGHARCGQE